jgi:hypothetical protein
VSKALTVRIDRCPKCGTTLRERSLEKNARLHAVLTEIAEQKQWAGQWLDAEIWKRLFCSAFERAHGRTAELYPAIDGKGLDVLYRRTSRMSQEEMRDLIHYIEAWALNNGVTLKELDPQP